MVIKMVKHIVIWRMNPTEDKNEKALLIKEKLEALKNEIDCIVSIEVGINFNQTEAASDIILVSEFNSKEDLDFYQEHAAHKAVGSEYVRPNVCERRVVDYEF